MLKRLRWVGVYLPLTTAVTTKGGVHSEQAYLIPSIIPAAVSVVKVAILAAPGVAGYNYMLTGRGLAEYDPAHIQEFGLSAVF